ncbi:MAG: hypothetical protein JWN70_6069, partial [Planctomycetaceae bacterium]|nr:hypothetical protein [Planctomycetaceae bacterium]
MLRLMILAALFLPIPPLAAFAEPMKFNYSGNGGNCDDCEFLVAKGDITPSTVDEFRALDVRNLQVMLDSKGGNLLGAIALGNEFRRRNIRVTVGDTSPRTDGSGMEEIAGTCESACVYAFFGGSRREVRPGSKIGIHALAAPSNITGLDPVYTEAEITNVQIQVGVVLEFTQRMGVDPIVVQWA